MLSWCQNPSILMMHKIRFFCHLGLAFMSVFMLSSTSVVLAYSLKMYRGTVLHSIPEILAASAVSIILVGLAWLPSTEHVGTYGINKMRTIWQELLWSGVITLAIAASLTSLHESTPGLMSSCGRYFICRGYIFIFVTTWVGWIMIAVPTMLLLASAVYQMRRSPTGDSVWHMEVDRFEYFWPGQTHLRVRRTKPVSHLPRVQPGIADLKSHHHHQAFPFENEKSPASFHNL